MLDFVWPTWVVDILKMWGPAAVLMLGFLWYVPRNAITAFIKSQQDQAVALSVLANSVKDMANEGGELRDSMTQVSVNQGVIASRTGRLEEKMDSVDSKLDSLLTKAGEGMGQKLDQLLERLSGQEIPAPKNT